MARRPTTLDYMTGGLIGHIYPFEDKDRSLSNLIRYTLDRTQSMFKYEGLPDTIPQRILELFLQINGHCAFMEHNGELYVFVGGLGGEPDVYYMPTVYTISNPALKFSVNAIIDKDCVVMPNDSTYTGLMPMLERYCSQIVENDISIKIASINSRIMSIISASDDRTYLSAKEFLKDIADGKLGAVADAKFLDGIKVQPNGTTGHTVITDLIELEQYIKASLFNELGLNANYNMKRESINSGESQLNSDALLPLIDDMLRCRQDALDKVNKMFGTNITVSFASSWEDNEEELEAEQETLKEETEPGEPTEETEETETEEPTENEEVKDNEKS